jgi:hypothetical protein
MTRTFGMTEIVAPNTLIEILTGSHIAGAGPATTQNVDVKHGEELVTSGRRDSNPRPLEPHSSVLPS